MMQIEKRNSDQGIDVSNESSNRSSAERGPSASESPSMGMTGNDSSDTPEGSLEDLTVPEDKTIKEDGAKEYAAEPNPAADMLLDGDDGKADAKTDAAPAAETYDSTPS